MGSRSGHSAPIRLNKVGVTTLEITMATGESKNGDGA